METPSMNLGLMQPVNIAEKVWDGFDRGVKRRQLMEDRERQNAARKAIVALQGDPGNTDALTTLYEADPQLGVAFENQMFQRGERQRASEFRGASSDMLLSALEGGSSNALAVGQQGPGNALQMPAQSPMHSSPLSVPSAGQLPDAAPINALAAPAPAEPAPTAPPPRDNAARMRAAYERAIRADPSQALKFQGEQLNVTKGQLEVFRNLNNTAMQLLGGVHDQASYENAKRQAASLYGRHGFDLRELGLPDQYNPELIEDLRLRGMDASKQYEAILRENRLEWDIADDVEDNERADERLDVTRRGQDLSDARGRRGQDMADRRARNGRGGAAKDTTPRTENALFTDIQRRFNKGEPITDREREFAREYKERQAAKGGKSRNRAGAGKVVSVRSVEEARALPAGTIFRTPDGRVKVR